MLGFILSKLNMLVFATAVFVIALMLLNFTSGIELKNVTSSNLNLQIQKIEEQLNNTTSQSSFKSIAIPDSLEYGLNKSNRLYYELGFSKVSVGDNTALILSIYPHGEENVIDSRRVITDASIVLIDPSFIATGEQFNDNTFNVDFMSLYPRAALSGDQALAANAFVALKSTRGEEEYMYIIPCSTLKKEVPTNCQANILRVGCYELAGENPSPNDEIHIDFDVTREILTTGEQVSGWTWQNCQDTYGTTLRSS